jgi:hypothetical protein
MHTHTHTHTHTHMHTYTHSSYFEHLQLNYDLVILNYSV